LAGLSAGCFSSTWLIKFFSAPYVLSY
jgi:hypothetical protein